MIVMYAKQFVPNVLSLFATYAIRSDPIHGHVQQKKIVSY